MMLPLIGEVTTPDQKIQIFILIVLVLTSIANLFYDWWHSRKRITFFQVELNSISGVVDILFSSNSEREIHTSFWYAETKRGDIADAPCSHREHLKDGQDGVLKCSFRDRRIQPKLDDFYKVIIKDGQRIYKSYLYKGFPRKYIIVQVLLFRDRLQKMLD